jgi:hypothetical protein
MTRADIMAMQAGYALDQAIYAAFKLGSPEWGSVSQDPATCCAFLDSLRVLAAKDGGPLYARTEDRGVNAGYCVEFYNRAEFFPDATDDRREVAICKAALLTQVKE